MVQFKKELIQRRWNNLFLINNHECYGGDEGIKKKITNN